MTEDEAIGWTEKRFPSSIVERLHLFAAMIAEENDRQNLVSPATLPTIWSRHIVDSLQLIALARPGGRWLDVGTGGGFPGLVVAIAGAVPMTLVEPRRRRTEFLRHCVDRLGCDRVDVVTGKVEAIGITAATISARAVASMENLLRAAGHCGTAETRWLLPRGSIDRAELADVATRHGMVFHVEQSVTQQESSIVILEPR